MLISFSVQNVRSIRDLQTLSMEEPRSDDHLKETNTFEAGRRRLVKSAVIFGPNASGKSNLIKALQWMKEFVRNSARESLAGDKIPYTPFRLSTETEHAPSYFEIEFLKDGFEYRYGFEVTADIVVSEWLFRKSADAKAARLFTREDDKIDCSPEFFKEGKGLEERTRPNALFLSVCAQFNGQEAGKVLKWFDGICLTSGLYDEFMELATECLVDPQRQTDLSAFIRMADLSIADINGRIERYTESDLPAGMPEALKTQMLKAGKKRSEIKTTHAKRDATGQIIENVEFDLRNDESNGTQKLVALAAPILYMLLGGGILVIDEVDARLHPLLTQALFDRFHSAENEKNAQLICTSHDVTLLEPERFRRDQVWFCEKDETEATRLYSLAEFDPQDVRPTTKFSRQYMKGLFGAVPKLAQFKEDVPHG